MKNFFRVLFYILAAVYPILVFTLLVVFKLPIRILSLCIVVIAFGFFLSVTGKNSSNSKKEKKALDWRPLVSSVLFLIAGIVCFVTENGTFQQGSAVFLVSSKIAYHLDKRQAVC